MGRTVRSRDWVGHLTGNSDYKDGNHSCAVLILLSRICYEMGENMQYLDL